MFIFRIFVVLCFFVMKTFVSTVPNNNEKFQILLNRNDKNDTTTNGNRYSELKSSTISVPISSLLRDANGEILNTKINSNLSTSTVGNTDLRVTISSNIQTTFFVNDSISKPSNEPVKHKSLCRRRRNAIDKITFERPSINQTKRENEMLNLTTGGISSIEDDVTNTISENVSDGLPILLANENEMEHFSTELHGPVVVTTLAAITAANTIEYGGEYVEKHPSNSTTEALEDVLPKIIDPVFVIKDAPTVMYKNHSTNNSTIKKKPIKYTNYSDNSNSSDFDDFASTDFDIAVLPTMGTIFISLMAVSVVVLTVVVIAFLVPGAVERQEMYYTPEIVCSSET